MQTYADKLESLQRITRDINNMKQILDVSLCHGSDLYVRIVITSWLIVRSIDRTLTAANGYCFIEAWLFQLITLCFKYLVVVIAKFLLLRC